jgi:hypothetical protein
VNITLRLFLIMVRAFVAFATIVVSHGDREITLMSGDKLMVKGQESSAQCEGVADDSACELDGSSNYHKSDLSLNVENGIFSGTMTTNQCSNDHYGYCALCDPPQYLDHTHTASCMEQVFPSVTGPAMAPLRGPVGFTKFGVNIYGPEEAGFGIGRNPKPCSDGSGTCPAGMDVPTCESSLDEICGSTGSTPVHELMLDSCGGHAMPYHYHNDNACDYDHTAAGHSPLIGFGLDGVGIYGLYENNPTKPNLDACNGHVGVVPADDEFGVPEGMEMYHYHVASSAPYTLGCYGNAGIESNPVDQDTCKTLYTTCNDGDLAAVTIDSTSYCYDLDCPCFDGSSDRIGRNSVETSCLETAV